MSKAYVICNTRKMRYVSQRILRLFSVAAAAPHLPSASLAMLLWTLPQLLPQHHHHLCSLHCQHDFSSWQKHIGRERPRVGEIGEGRCGCYTWEWKTQRQVYTSTKVYVCCTRLLWQLEHLNLLRCRWSNKAPLTHTPSRNIANPLSVPFSNSNTTI